MSDTFSSCSLCEGFEFEKCLSGYFVTDGKVCDLLNSLNSGAKNEASAEGIKATLFESQVSYIA